VLGAILAGGRSERMGTDKATFEVGGRTMLDRVAEALAEAVGTVVLLGRKHDSYAYWPDAVDVPGPLAGIATALSRARDPWVLVIAVDNAFVRAETLLKLAAVRSDLPVVPVDHEGVRQVTCAVYPTSIAELAVEEAEVGGSIQSLLDRVSFQPVTPDIWEEWGEDGRSWYSVDTAEAAREGIRRFG